MEIRVPRLAEGVESATVANVLVAEGDRIEKDQTILDLETEKAVGPIPSPEAGEVEKIHVQEGQEVSIGQVLITLAEGEGKEEDAHGVEEKHAAAGEEGQANAPQEREESPRPEKEKKEEKEKEPPPTEKKDRERGSAEEYRYESQSGVPPPAPPSIRKMARQLGIDLTRVKGSQSGGRITLVDMRAHLQRLQDIAFGKQEPAQPKKQAPAAADFSRWGPVNKKRMSSLRRTVAQRMLDSWSTIPHVTQFDEADITSLMNTLNKHGRAYEAKGARLTFTALALKAAVTALQKHPVFNSSLDERAGEIVFKEYFHLGIAVDTEDGLVVPIIRDVDKKGLLAVARELNEMVKRTRERAVAVEDLQGGTFTISNQGALGSAHFTPIIYKPQVAILGLGQAAWKPVIQGNAVTPRLLLPLSLSYDHRVNDGAGAVRFMGDIVAALENFSEKDVKP